MSALIVLGFVVIWVAGAAATLYWVYKDVGELPPPHIGLSIALLGPLGLLVGCAVMLASGEWTFGRRTD